MGGSERTAKSRDTLEQWTAPVDMRDAGAKGEMCRGSRGSLHIGGTSQGRGAAGMLTKPAPCRETPQARPGYKEVCIFLPA